MGNSFLGKQYAYAPGKLPFDPLGKHFFGGYGEHGNGDPGPYAGITPTLADANRGYTGLPSGPTSGMGASPYVAASQNVSKQYGTPGPQMQTPMQPPRGTYG